MAISISTGTVVAIASTYGTAANMTAITNAAEAVATLAAGHGVVVGDFLEVTSGWGRLDKRIVRAKTVVTNDITFEGINTTSTTLYPAGAGTGTIRRITAWTNLTQLQSISLSGGEQQFTDITTIEDVIQKQAPTTRSPFTLTATAFYDAALAWWSTVRTVGDTQALTAARVVFPSGNRIVANGYWSLAEIPNVEANAPLTHQVVCAFAVAATPYAT
jgi:hypothetical protein